MSDAILQRHYLNEQTADVFFVCVTNDGQAPVRVPAHKIIMASKSTVFEAMFYGGLPEKGDVTLPANGIAFKAFLKFFYFTHVDLTTMDNISEIVDLVNKYQVANGFTVCEEFLKQNLTKDNFMSLYDMAITYNLMTLQLYCENNVSEMLSENDIYKCTRDEFKQMLQIKRLYTAFDLFDVCVKWAKFQCEQQGINATDLTNVVEQLGDCLEHIEWGSMTQKHIKDAFRNYEQLITPNMMKKIINIQMARGSSCDTNVIAKCGHVPADYTRDVRQVETMTLRGSTDMWIKAVGLPKLYLRNGSTFGQPVIVEMTITKVPLQGETNSLVLLRETFQLQASPRNNSHTAVFVHRFNSSVLLDAGHAYEIQVKLPLKSDGEVYVRSKMNETGEITYRTTNDDEMKIFFGGDPTIIASLGIAFRYLDPRVVDIGLVA